MAENTSDASCWQKSGLSRPRNAPMNTQVDTVRRAVKRASHLLPAQGPIGVFVHHNTLHAFQHLPFEQAVAEASALFGTEAWMREEQYREEFSRGRILLEDIDAVLNSEANAPVYSWLDRVALRRIMLVPGVRPFHRSTIRWEIEEGNLLRSSEDRKLFEACLNSIERPPKPPEPSPRRLRDILLDTTGDDLDEIVHPLLIRLCSSYLDQGLAYWPMPDRRAGFYRCVRTLWHQRGALLPNHLRDLPAEFRRQMRAGMNSEEAVADALKRLRVPITNYERIITSELLALPGWAGLMNRLEHEPELAPHDRVRCSLMDFLAVRLTLTSVAALSLAGDPETLEALQTAPPSPPSLELDRLVEAAQMFEVAKAARLSADRIMSDSPLQLRVLLEEIRRFNEFERRRVWHLAYERRHERSVLGPLGVHRQSTPIIPSSKRPAAQYFFCIDEREESIRRNLEEIAPDIETFSAAGFFGIAVDYAGIDDAHGASLCPVVVKPQHAVRERPVTEDEPLHEKRKTMRAAWATIVRSLSLSSRTLIRGSLSTSVLGLFSLIPLIAHVLTPRQYARLARALNRWILPEPRTELTLMRTDREGHDISENLLLGFTVEEKIERVASVLAPVGLRINFAPVVIILGHGSTSLNNPHESAHDCGACGGRRGGPNARLFAAMANHPEVRKGLKERGICIPDDTWFVGGYHDTCSDDIEYYDVDFMPEAFRPGFEAAKAILDRARMLNAHERARRFEAAPLDLTPEEAFRHVQERSEHLAEPRPEYGHATNAVCIVGRRQTTKGLFLDRRAFLVSYDPLQDPTNENLAKLLAAAIPVCAGISLEYYFSYVDNDRYGCGTKLPHNITGLVGVMDGHASDLRTGLPWQMVEIHEPVRVLFNVETTPDRLMSVINGNPSLRELVENRWIRLSTLDPDTGVIHVYRDGIFEESPPWKAPVPEVRSSMEWYRGKRGHLPIARVVGTRTRS